MKDQYSLALHKLDELALAGKDPVTNSGKLSLQKLNVSAFIGKAPVKNQKICRF